MGKAVMIVSVCFLCLADPLQETGQEVMQQIDFNEIDSAIHDIFNEDQPSFSEMVLDVVGNKQVFSFKEILEKAFEYLLKQAGDHKNAMVQVLAIAMIASLFHLFSDMMGSKQTAEVSFYVVYILMAVILLKVFFVLSDVSVKLIQDVVAFMRSLIPAYFLSVAFACGGTSSIVFYEFMLFVISAVEWVLLNIVIPLIHIYIVIKMVNYISKENFLSKLAELFGTCISWILKSMLSVIVGFQIIQSLITPIVDGFKHSLLSKTAMAIPGVGGALSATTELMIGSGIIIKNGIGVAALIILVGICAAPVLYLAAISFFYKLITALIQPISDDRTIGCVSCVTEGFDLLLKTTVTAGALFMLTIAIVAISTNGAG